MPVRSDRRRRSRLHTQLVAGVGGAVALAVPVAPTGVALADRLLAAAVVAGVALAAPRAPRWTWLVLTGVAATFAATAPAAVAGVAGIVVASLASWRDRPRPVEGALAGVLGALTTLRMADGGITGGSLLLGLVATGPVLWWGYRGARRRTRRVLRAVALGVGAALAVATLGYVVAVLSARGSANQGERRLEQALDLARAGDLDGAEARFDAAADAFAAAARRLRVPWALPARVLPGLGPNARAAAGALDLAVELAEDVVDVVATVGTDELAVRDGRVDPGAFRRLAEPVGGLLTSIGRAEQRAADLDSPWLVAPLADRLATVADELRRARETTDLAVDAVDALPVLLGAGGEQRYLVLFVTPVEARATGFPGNFAELVVRDGAFALERFGRISDLVFPPGDVALDLPRAFLDRYLRFGIGVQWRSVTVSPDFPSVASGPLFKIRDDPRVSRIGRFLRRYSIDELPQLVNVVRGEMSLVGPRPPLPEEVANYDERTARRLLVRPGMTGLWQVSGRSDLGWDEGVYLDVLYVDHWSPLLDLAIVARTVLAVLRPRGAY